MKSKEYSLPRQPNPLPSSSSSAPAYRETWADAGRGRGEEPDEARNVEAWARPVAEAILRELK